MNRWILASLLLSSAAHANVLYVASAGTGQILAIDLTTQASKPIGNLTSPFDWGGLSWSESNSRLYEVSGRGDMGLYRVNPLTGASTLIGYHNIPDVFANAANPINGNVYALQANGYAGLYRLDTTTGAATFIGTPNIPGLGYAGVGGADFDSAGRIIANSSFSSAIYAINPANANATYLGDPGVSVSDNGLAVDRDTGLIYIAEIGGVIYEIDPSAGFRARPIHQGGMYTSATILPDGVIDFMEASTGGACPGASTLQVANATPNGQVAIAYSTGPAGVFNIPGGACSGTQVPLSNPRLGRTVRADAAGNISINLNLAGGLCSMRWAAVDLTTCAVSNFSMP
jgi:hypothetical protein